ncbi:transcriptional regulator [Saccharothrix longispora]|uniref:transcriptional regulator n=1 Tax=Saccharothrix longispora TaxID=33920 RepID=UPI0028FD7535|nr:transcriptional regulator [Saccharothrix longispora]MDU0293813.1 transcriptional regulator [Saccharothrix longispora]
MPPTVKLRVLAFTTAAREAGYRSDYALADAMHVHRSTISRVVSGHLTPGPAFIAAALTVLTPANFEDLFEIVATDPAKNTDHPTTHDH